MNYSDLIYVAGHTDLTGSAVVSEFKSKGFSNVLCVSLEELELTDQYMVDLVYEKHAPKYLVLAERQVERKLLESIRIMPFGWQPSVEFEQGLQTTYLWYLENMVEMELHT